MNEQIEKLSITMPNLYRLFENTENKYKRVMIHCSWTSSKEIWEIWKKMSFDNNGTWNDIKLVYDYPADFHVVINSTYDNIDLSKTIYFCMEPYLDPKFWGDFWSSPSPSLFLFYARHGDNVEHYNNLEWHLSKSYCELINYSPKKNKILSTILSQKYFDPGHKKRIDFVKFLDKRNLDIDVYGNNRFGYKNYKKELPYHCKDEGLFNYKYTFNAENNNINGYFTEKLIDGILAECLVFYNGCPDIDKYIDPKAFVYLELVDYEYDFQIVKKAIENDLWSERIAYIRKAKEKILNDLQFFPRISKILKTK